MAVALCIAENGRKITASDIVNGVDEGEHRQAALEEGQQPEALTDAIRDKYCQVREFYDADIPSALRLIKETARHSKPGVKPVEKVTSMILERRFIGESGPKEVLASLCLSLTELRLGGNIIGSWQAVSTILLAVPTLQVLDLANNKTLREALQPAPPTEPHPSLRVLVLSCTCVPFLSILTMIEWLPGLHELHASKNGYSNGDLSLQRDSSQPDSAHPNSAQPHIGLTRLLLAENNITEWAAVEELSQHFPNLDYLMLNSNPLVDIAPGNGNWLRLSDLHLNKTCIASWRYVECLCCLPSLSHLSILHVPIKEGMNEEISRYAVVARLPALHFLNKSSISEEERERAERWLIREYHDKPETRPDVYQSLVDKHGNLQPLPSIDLSPKLEVSVTLSYDGVDRAKEVVAINLKQTLKQLKGWIGRRAGVPPSTVSLYPVYNSEAERYHMQELQGNSRNLYVFGINDGDTIEVVVRV